MTYAAAAHNAWHDEHLAGATESFYGAARQLAHRRFLERFPPSGCGRLLDVGCGLGYFVASARDAGWEAFGCDTSDSWVRHARALVGAERISRSEVSEGMFGGRFDLVTAWDVLEHVHDPLPFLSALASLLAHGGRVFIRTPNLAWIYPTYSLRRRLLGERVELGPLNHVVYYTSATLTRALTSAGLQPTDWPVLPPPQVRLGNREPAGTDLGNREIESLIARRILSRRPGDAGQLSPVIRAKNVHAASAEQLARASAGRIVAGADLDVVAVRAGGAEGVGGG